MSKLTSLTAAAVLSLTLNVAQAADIPEGAKSLTVAFADLNLSRPEGAATLHKRIKEAARQVCSDLDGRALRNKQLRTECMEFAMRNAIAATANPALAGNR